MFHTDMVDARIRDLRAEADARRLADTASDGRSLVDRIVETVRSAMSAIGPDAVLPRLSDYPYRS